MDAKSNFEKQAGAGQKSEEQLAYERVCQQYGLDANAPGDVIKFIMRERSGIHKAVIAEDGVLNDMKLAKRYANSIQSTGDGADNTPAEVITPKEPVYVGVVDVSSLLGKDEDPLYDSNGRTYNNSPARKSFVSCKA